MKVLVTGGNGYVGSHVVKRLIYMGHTVSVWDSAFNTVDSRE